MLGGLGERFLDQAPGVGDSVEGDEAAHAGALRGAEQRYLFDEQRSWADLLATLASADRPESRGQIEHEVASARLHLRTRDSNGRSLLSQFDKLGIKPDPAGVPIRMDLQRLCRALEG
jgi:hypothetical protein